MKSPSALAVALVLMFGSPSAHAATWRPGDRVLASPTMMEASWQICVVVAVPQGLADGYQLNCAKDPARGTSMRTVPAKWIKAAPLTLPGTSAEMAPRSAAPRVAPPPPPRPTVKASAPALPTVAAPPAGAKSVGGAVRLGDYECWAFNRARMGLNFSILSAARYKDSEGKTGSFTYDAASERIAFQGGLLDGGMPKGFYSIYHEPHGIPTVSFRSSGGSEASFCERAR